jgi:hypothetical protein
VPDLDKIALLPMKGSPLPEGGVLAADCVHAQIVKAAPWAPAKPVLDLYGGDADLVLLAVPVGLGPVLAAWIAEQTIAVEDPGANSVSAVVPGVDPPAPDAGNKAATPGSSEAAGATPGRSASGRAANAPEGKEKP